MKITYQTEAVTIPKVDKSKAKRKRSQTYKIIETLLTSNLSTSIIEFDNKSKMESVYSSFFQLIKKDNLPIRVSRRELTLYVMKVS